MPQLVCKLQTVRSELGSWLGLWYAAGTGQEWTAEWTQVQLLLYCRYHSEQREGEAEALVRWKPGIWQSERWRQGDDRTLLSTRDIHLKQQMNRQWRLAYITLYNTNGNNTVQKKCIDYFPFYSLTIFRQDDNVFREDAVPQGELSEPLLQVNTDFLSAAWGHSISCFNPQQILNSSQTAELWGMLTYCKAYWGPQTLLPLSWWCGPKHSHHTRHQQCACRCHCSKLMKAETHWLGHFVCVLCLC